MNDTARLYNCSRCHSQVFICRHCDRSNIYCNRCAPQACIEAKRRAARRYQASPQGRANHAARQRRYRERLRQKVTHKGSIRPSVHDLLRDKWKRATMHSTSPVPKRITPIVCHFCWHTCSAFLRQNFLQSSA